MGESFGVHIYWWLLKKSCLKRALGAAAPEAEGGTPGMSLNRKGSKYGGSE